MICGKLTARVPGPARITGAATFGPGCGQLKLRSALLPPASHKETRSAVVQGVTTAVWIKATSPAARLIVLVLSPLPVMVSASVR